MLAKMQQVKAIRRKGRCCRYVGVMAMAHGFVLLWSSLGGVGQCRCDMAVSMSMPLTMTGFSTEGRQVLSSWRLSWRICGACETWYATKQVSTRHQHQSQASYLFEVVVLVTTILAIPRLCFSLRRLLRRLLWCSMVSSLGSNVVRIWVIIFRNAS
jgi:hypothetical protein